MIDWIQKLTAVYGVGKVATAIITTILLLVVGTVFATTYVVKQNTKLDVAVTSARKGPATDSLILCRLIQIETNNKIRQDSIQRKLTRVESRQELYQNTNTIKFNRLADGQTVGKEELKRSFAELDLTVRASIINFSPSMYQKKNNSWNEPIPLLGMIQHIK